MAVLSYSSPCPRAAAVDELSQVRSAAAHRRADAGDYAFLFSRPLYVGASFAPSSSGGVGLLDVLLAIRSLIFWYARAAAEGLLIALSLAPLLAASWPHLRLVHHPQRFGRRQRPLLGLGLIEDVSRSCRARQRSSWARARVASLHRPHHHGLAQRDQSEPRARGNEFGASRTRTFFSVVLPLSVPGLPAVSFCRSRSPSAHTPRLRSLAARQRS